MERKQKLVNAGISQLSNYSADRVLVERNFSNMLVNTQISTQLEHTSTGDFKVLKIVGRGSFGVVRQC
jgi:hypothetical protein